jgi:hypothetical protein
LQPVPQLAEVPVQRKGAQLGDPAERAAARVQVPGVEAHSSQRPAQAVLQQKPSAQKVLVHSLPPRQVAPLALSGVQPVDPQ